MKSAHPHPADIAMKECEKVSVCLCRRRGYLDRDVCESKYKEAVTKIIQKVVYGQ